MTRSVARGLWSNEGSLGQKAVRGGIWVLGSGTVIRVLGIVQTIILVRLLVPEDFGLMRIGMFVLAGITIFTQANTGAAIVQLRNVTKATLDVAWTINLARGLLLWAVVYFSAPWLATFYRNPIISPVVRVLAFRFLVGGFANPALSLFTKEMNFKVVRLWEALCSTVTVALTVVLAFVLRDVWALVYGSVFSMFFGIVGSYVIRPYRPRLSLHWAEARRILSFGLNLTAVGVLGFLATQADVLVVGKMLDMSRLGFYSLAFSLSLLASRCLSGVVSKVMFPAYSTLQDDLDHLRAVFFRVFRVLAVMALPASVGLFLLAPELVRIVYTPRYMVLVPTFRVLTFFGLMGALSSATGPLFMGVGKPSYLRNLHFAQLVVLAALIYPLTKYWGIWGAGLATTLAMSTAMVYAFAKTESLLGAGTLKGCLQLLWPLFGPLAAMTAAVLAAKAFIGVVTVPALLATVGAGALFYIGPYILLNRSDVLEWKRLLRKALATSS